MSKSCRSAAAGLGAAAAVVLLACAAPPPPGAPAPRLAVLDSVRTTPPLHHTQWGVAVQDLRTGERLAGYNGGLHFIPASNTKLIVTAVALGTLGPDWRWQTPIEASARSDSGTVARLVIRAQGDPTWSTRFFPSDHAVLDTIAMNVASAGIRTIDELVIDASRFRDAPVHPSWEIGDLPFAYAPPIEAFAIGEGTFRLLVVPALEPGGAAAVVALGVPAQPVVAQLVTDTVGGRTSTQPDERNRVDTVYVRGTLAAGGPPDTLTLAVTSPARFATIALRQRLEAFGIRVATTRIVYDSAEAAALSTGAPLHEVGRIVSPPLADVVAAILRPSQNWIAEHLLKTLGAELGEGGTWADGIDVEQRWLVDVARIDSSAFQFRDASGLSVQNLLTPDAIVTLLAHAHAQAWGEAYREALPWPGLPDGTLENRLAGLETRLRAKTGTITNVATLSGYITTAQGRELAFSIMANASGVSAAAVRRGIDRIVRALANGERL